MSFRYALKQYIDHPEKHSNNVVFYDNDVVIIKDQFPKSICHYLVLPRDEQVTRMHPLEVFSVKPQLYEHIEKYIKKTKRLIVEQLCECGLLDAGDELGRASFMNTFIKAGVHSIPSMNNLHFHVITQDFHSDRMKNKKHYNSFTTSFFVEFETLNPLEMGRFGYLAGGDDNDSSSVTSDEYDAAAEQELERDETKLMSILKNTPLTCTYCSKTFDNQLRVLKTHLAREFQAKFKGSNEVKITPNGFT